MRQLLLAKNSFLRHCWRNWNSVYFSREWNQGYCSRESCKPPTHFYGVRFKALSNRTTSIQFCGCSNCFTVRKQDNRSQIKITDLRSKACNFVCSRCLTSDTDLRLNKKLNTFEHSVTLPPVYGQCRGTNTSYTASQRRAKQRLTARLKNCTSSSRNLKSARWGESTIWVVVYVFAILGQKMAKEIWKLNYLQGTKSLSGRFFNRRNQEYCRRERLLHPIARGHGLENVRKLNSGPKRRKELCPRRGKSYYTPRRE